jgi:3-oxoacyl-[acyl-carrier protein] reductase
MKRRLALVTGGCSGIGLAVARLLAADHDLALAYASNADRAAAVVRELESANHASTVRVFGGRLRTYDDARALLENVTQAYDAAPGVLVNCVGRIHDELFIGSRFDVHEALIQEHLIVSMALAHLVARSMYKARFGRIVNLSSIAARYAKRGQTSYAAAKAGLEGFSRTLAIELAHRGVTVNIVAPGLIETPMTRDFIAGLTGRAGGIAARIPAGTVGAPEDVAGLIKFLCSEQARYITGAVLTVDGGRSLGDVAS